MNEDQFLLHECVHRRARRTRVVRSTLFIARAGTSCAVRILFVPVEVSAGTTDIGVMVGPPVATDWRPTTIIDWELG